MNPPGNSAIHFGAWQCQAESGRTTFFFFGLMTNDFVKNILNKTISDHHSFSTLLVVTALIQKMSRSPLIIFNLAVFSVDMLHL